MPVPPLRLEQDHDQAHQTDEREDGLDELHAAILDLRACRSVPGPSGQSDARRSLPLGPLHRGAAGPAVNRLAPDSVVKEPDGSGEPHELRREPHSLLFEPRSPSFARLKVSSKPHSPAFVSRSLRFERRERLSAPHSPVFASHESRGMASEILFVPRA